MHSACQAQRRLLSVSSHIAAAELDLPQPGSGPGGQGYGPRAERAQQPPAFRCPEQLHEALEFFGAEGFCLFEEVLSADELGFLNGWLDAHDPEHDAVSGGQSAGPWSGNVLFNDDGAQLDRYTMHPKIMPFVTALYGKGNERFAQFDFRETKAAAGPGAMAFHHDAVLPNRLTRENYGPADWICSICYLTDVDEDSPAFAVVPKSVRFEPIGQAKVALGDDYVEVPILAKAGSCVFYDTATYHTRLDSLTGERGRRTMHQYWSRGGYLESKARDGHGVPQRRHPTPSLTNWVRIPERLCASADPATRLFFSHWNTGQCEWAANGFKGDPTGEFEKQ